MFYALAVVCFCSCVGVAHYVFAMRAVARATRSSHVFVVAKLPLTVVAAPLWALAAAVYGVGVMLGCGAWFTRVWGHGAVVVLVTRGTLSRADGERALAELGETPEQIATLGTALERAARRERDPEE